MGVQMFNDTLGSSVSVVSISDGSSFYRAKLGVDSTSTESTLSSAYLSVLKQVMSTFIFAASTL